MRRRQGRDRAQRDCGHGVVEDDEPRAPISVEESSGERRNHNARERGHECGQAGELWGVIALQHEQD